MIVVFGSVNLDTIYTLDELPTAGRTVIGRSAQIEPGGKGANQAVAAALDGAKVVFAGAVGQDAIAETALAGMVAARVDLSGLQREAALPTGSASICVDRTGQNHIAVASGANLLAREDRVPDEYLGPATTLVLQMEVDAGETAALIRRARRRGARIVLSLAPAGDLAPDAIRMVDWLLVNVEEAAWLAGQLGCCATAGALHSALDTGVVRTLGANGLEAADAALAVTLAAAPCRVVDTTGAGDCFAGVFATALDRGLGIPAALKRANIAAGLCCETAGTQGSLPVASRIDEAIRRLE